MSPRHQGGLAHILQAFAGDTITGRRVSPGVTSRVAGGVEGVTGMARSAGWSRIAGDCEHGWLGKSGVRVG